MLFGAHCSTAGGVASALERAVRIGADCCQLFVKNNMQWFARPFREEELQAFHEVRQRAGLACVFGHAGYLINLAAPPSSNRDKSVRSLVEEIGRAAQLELPFLVVHPGAHLGAGVEAGLRRVSEAIEEVVTATRGLGVRIALENTAGQGTCLGGELWHLAEVYQRVGCADRLAICLDTAHLWGAGYDIRVPAGWDRVWEELERWVGLDQVVAFHLNDSKAALGSRRDRHEHIGRGRLGREAFRLLVSDPRFDRLPGCLETPKSEDLHEDRENLAVLRSLCATGGGRRLAKQGAWAGGRRSRAKVKWRREGDSNPRYGF
ncbi:deoxyribonuclease IV [Limisphaera sp. 4302-co]|uniref:deoxyribonuclease IV n=1 Tax=Limisphaera sp. 4302-co TaxID=3400417 RepID=UPI003C1ED7CC